MLSADTTLKLYAGGNSGSDRERSTSPRTSRLAATAQRFLRLTRSPFSTESRSRSPAQIGPFSTNNANYARSDGGNGSTSGTFAGGANNPQPLNTAPLFDGPSARLAAKQTSSARSGGGIGHTIHITDSSQLGSLLENASPGRDGKVRVAAIARNSSAPHALAQTSRVANASSRHRSVDTNVVPRILASRTP